MVSFGIVDRARLLPAILGISIFLSAAAVSQAGTASLSSLTIKPDAPVSGNVARGTVTLASPAGAGGVVVMLSSSNTMIATVPASLNILAGKSTAAFTIKTGAVEMTTSVTIKATSANAISATLTINPAATENWSGGPAPVFPVTNQCFAGDFNGDGKADLACYSGGGNWNVVLSTGFGWEGESWGGGPGPAIPVTDQCFARDFNGDGKTDLACWTGEGGSWNVALSTGSNWNSQFWNNGPVPVDEWNVVPVSGQCFAADFNGNGKTDLACYSVNTGVWSIALSKGTGWKVETWSGGPVVPLPMTQQCLRGDFNGDGKADLACWTGEDGGWAVSLSTGSSWNSALWNGGPSPIYEWNIIPVGEQCFAADFNGDGKTDLACYTASAGVWSVALSSGHGW